ncbi:MAG TPA: type IV secretion system DNA-binding domain-containing protein, partial [Candidatus Sumerlaeota bacterium]|nr:type IV secretion system DNA-binding domain-containing protein [Candidatus Sumerlaeota bacterium]
DILAGRGFVLLDPHGDLVERLVPLAREKRPQDLIYFDVSDREHPLGFNPLEQIAPEKRALAASGLLEAFKKIWADSWGPRSEHVLRAALLTLLEQPEATLADIPRLFSDAAFRKSAAAEVANPHVRDFWLREYEGYPARFRAEVIAPLQNKVGAFLTNPLLARILTQPRSDFKLGQVMNQGKILLVNLAKGKIGEDTASLLGALLVSRIGLAAMNRAELPESARRDFFVYLDEFHTFAGPSLAGMLSELRKYRVGLILSHQHFSQLDPAVLDAILGNVGTVIAFRVGLTEAQVLEQEFFPVFSASDLTNLPNHAIYLKLLIDGRVSRPFSAETLPAGDFSIDKQLRKKEQISVAAQ